MLCKFVNDEIRRKLISRLWLACLNFISNKAICGDVWLIFQVSSGVWCVILISCSCSSFKFKTSWLFYVPNKQIPYVVGNFYGKFFIDYFKRTKKKIEHNKRGRWDGGKETRITLTIPPPPALSQFSSLHSVQVGPGFLVQVIQHGWLKVRIINTTSLLFHSMRPKLAVNP